MVYRVLNNLTQKKYSLKIVIFFALIIISVAPFIIVSFIQDGNINFEDCYIEKTGDDFKTVRIIIN